MGFCPSCGQHEPLAETAVTPRRPGLNWVTEGEAAPRELSEIPLEAGDRVSLGTNELDRVLGGGLVPGSVVLMAGEPGVGKSTLLLQAADALASRDHQVLYVAGEESAQQIGLRSKRLGHSGKGIYMLPETDVDRVVQQLEKFRPAVAMVDSIQTLSTADVPSGPGSVAQVRECALRLLRWARGRAVPVIIAGHVTKDGSVAGPRVLEHMVDVVLYLEGENLSSYRVLRGVKNRFGSINEVGIFQMGDAGLEEVPDPSSVLLSQRQAHSIGSAVVPVMEGNRPLMVEIQALTSYSGLPVPRRVANGIDHSRLLMLVAVLSRRVGLNLSDQDVIVSVAGGLTVREPAADLAVAMAIASSLRNAPLDPWMVSVGEVGLSGELRTAHQVRRRLTEAARLGFRACLLPGTSKDQWGPIQGMEPNFDSTLAQAITRYLKGGRSERVSGVPVGLIEEHV